MKTEFELICELQELKESVKRMGQYVTHEMYNTCIAGANSYVTIFHSLEEARQEMYDSIYNHIAHCEEATMQKMVDRLKWFFAGDDSVKEIIDGFKMRYSDSYYHIIDENNEDQYHFAILDIKKWAAFSLF